MNTYVDRLRCPICGTRHPMAKDRFIRHICERHGVPLLPAIDVFNTIQLYAQDPQSRRA